MKQAGSSVLLKALPLKLQQTAFENAYLKAQEGMRAVVILVICICYYRILSINIPYITLPTLSQDSFYLIVYSIKLDYNRKGGKEVGVVGNICNVNNKKS